MFSSETFESLKMKRLLDLVTFLVFSVWLYQAEAYRIPLPYGTGIHEKNGPNLEFFTHIWSYFNQDDLVEVSMVSEKGISLMRNLIIYAYLFQKQTTPKSNADWIIWNVRTDRDHFENRQKQVSNQTSANL